MINVYNYDGPPPSYNETVVKSRGFVEFNKGDYVSDLNSNDIGMQTENDLDLLEDNQLDYDSQYEINNEAFIMKQIEQNYPTRYVKIDSIIMFLVNCALIIFQIVAMNNNAALSYTGAGIWAGLFNILTAFLDILTSNLFFCLWTSLFFF